MSSFAHLNWFWIGLMMTAPAIVAMILSMPFWRKGQSIFGGIVGTTIIFGSAVGLILREYVEIDRVVRQCLDAGTVCWPEPTAFTRFAIYAFIGLIEVFTLFIVSLKFEERARRRHYAREWQR